MPIIVNYKAVYLLNKIYVGLVIVAAAPELRQKCDDFFLKKRMKGFFVYVLEFMLTFDTMQIPVL